MAEKKAYPKREVHWEVWDETRAEKEPGMGMVTHLRDRSRAVAKAEEAADKALGHRIVLVRAVTLREPVESFTTRKVNERAALAAPAGEEGDDNG